ncbi:MAG: hypothetical protein ACLQE9_22200 [Roseiarcus sp.]
MSISSQIVFGGFSAVRAQFTGSMRLRGALPDDGSGEAQRRQGFSIHKFDIDRTSIVAQPNAPGDLRRQFLREAPEISGIAPARPGRLTAGWKGLLNIQ